MSDKTPDTFESLVREMVAYFGDATYHEDDYGRVYCMFCVEDEGKPHAPDCIYVRAKRLIEVAP